MGGRERGGEREREGGRERGRAREREGERERGRESGSKVTSRVPSLKVDIDSHGISLRWEWNVLNSLELCKVGLGARW